MSVRIDEISTLIEPVENTEREGATAAGGASEAPLEVRIEELRPLVRLLVAEEIERWLRTRSEWL